LYKKNLINKIKECNRVSEALYEQKCNFRSKLHLMVTFIKGEGIMAFVDIMAS